MSAAPVAYSKSAGENIAPFTGSVAGRRERVFTAFNRALVLVVPVAAVMLAPGVTSQKLVATAVVAGLWLVALRSAHSHPRLSPLGTTVFTAVGVIEGLGAVSLASFWIPGVDLSIRQLLLMAAAVFVLSAAYEARIRSPASRRRLLLVAADDRIRELVDELSRAPQLPFEVIGIVDDKPVDGLPGTSRLGTTGELKSVVRELRPDLVVLGREGCRADALSHMFDVASLDVRVVDVHHFNEHAFGKVPVQHLSPLWFMGVLHLYQRPYSRVVKRVFDIVVAAFALVILAPPLLAISLIVRRSSPGPVFFRQLRLGEGGKLFAICKFRTMVEGAEAPGVAVWAAEDDPRVTRIGRLLRRTRLDELPQFWNVLRGDMSIVGPRPERPEFVELLQDTVPFWTRRHLVKPGITGWAQVRRGYTADAMGTAEKLAYDLYYLKYRSFLFDLAIAARTVRVVLSGFGSR
jgi:exopolysaccharide biosynthesis polyprenyl glycosylphosphotransferase